MKRECMSLLCVLLLLLGGDSLHQVVAAGEEAFDQIDYARAIAIYESALQKYPEEPQLLWRLSRTYVTLGEAIEPEKKEELFRKAELYARACIRANENIAKGHTGLAAALGSIALISGNKAKAKFSQEIKRELSNSIRVIMCPTRFSARIIASWGT